MWWCEHGFTFLWLILFSCIIKVFVQIELGRYAISSGKPTLGALKDISTIKAIGLVLLFWWFVMMLCTVFQLGGMTGGVGQALNLAFPQFGPGSAAMIENVSPSAAAYVQTRHEIPWAVVICGLTIALIFNGSYRRIEWITTLLVVGVTLVTCLAMFSILFTEFAPHPNAIASGLKLTIPEQGIAVAFGVFGITGVGATELFYYPYWCLEKGYARYVAVTMAPRHGKIAHVAGFVSCTTTHGSVWWYSPARRSLLLHGSCRTTSSKHHSARGHGHGVPLAYVFGSFWTLDPFLLFDRGWRRLI